MHKSIDIEIPVAFRVCVYFGALKGTHTVRRLLPSVCILNSALIPCTIIDYIWNDQTVCHIDVLHWRKCKPCMYTFRIYTYRAQSISLPGLSLYLSIYLALVVKRQERNELRLLRTPREYTHRIYALLFDQQDLCWSKVCTFVSVCVCVYAVKEL